MSAHKVIIPLIWLSFHAQLAVTLRVNSYSIFSHKTCTTDTSQSGTKQDLTCNWQQRIRKGVSFSGLCLPEITQLPCCTASQLRKSNRIHSLTLFRFVSRRCSLPENTEESAHTASWHRGVIVAGVWSDWCLGWGNAHWSGSCILPQNFARLM